MNKFHSSLVCCYLYPITKYGYPPKAENTIKYIEEMYDLGFSSIELEGIREQHLLEVYKIRFEIKDKLAELKMNVPYFCAVLPGLSSSDSVVRNKNLKLFEKGCEIAHCIGAKGILDNAPLPPYQFPKDIPIVRHYNEKVLQTAQFPSHLNWNKYWTDLTETIRTACEIANSKRLTYQMHPCLGVLSATTDAFLYFADTVKAENLRFNLDTANQFVVKDNLALSLIRLKDKIDYIHVSDNRGIKVEHLPIGKGNIHWDSFFEIVDKINFKGHFGLDIGGAESDVKDLDSAYRNSADFIEKMTKTQN
ncbi:MAG: sugar phosphate isomerase/epimerase [Prolixibacteraceae bacterium]|jgi:sugar phosphate isomerase/epimerase|nr:sugar phosphate isomerase/epimerase [Prolixibacteraceae bacterium]MBT6005500.1 sugar phosphate isomerase/epimerase [Prolixibacteraceae bacterium]MBT6766115.1 sugar phosphate isomerase/epimerase [Prolixibacteraceae bacterium]MBT7000795.1 sugar phosphate isomerase/epimerase [Prolixibacteraceae bacterium]MBT7393568.1 sugar phosphate isomerase/epimerase [Prolixibacteraceae bacterium]